MPPGPPARPRPRLLPCLGPRLGPWLGVWLGVWLGLVAGAAGSASQRPPHIVFILADDMGWNDVSYHGSNQIPTPNLDALAFSGVLLSRHYVQPVCTPTRAALMTGKYPIRLGMQGRPLSAAEPRGLPLSETLLPEHLRRLGYATHAVGKWHLGFFRREYTPTFRGFDSFFGHLSGFITYYTHEGGYNETPGMPSGLFGHDLRRNSTSAWGVRGRYATDLFTQEAERLVEAHDPATPLFLYLSHLAPHSGALGSLVEAPAEAERPLQGIASPNRRKYAAMMTKLDESVGRVVQALQRKNMLQNSIIVFCSDNGAPSFGNSFQNYGSNYPLRGLKDSVFEGGVRSPALLWSGLLRAGQRVSQQLVHITDWLPTLYSAAGGNVSELGELDGLDQWTALADNRTSPRSELLVNYLVNITSGIIEDNWKLTVGVSNANMSGYYGDSGQEIRGPALNAQQLSSSRAGRAIARLGAAGPRLPNNTQLAALRRQATVDCGPGPVSSTCQPTTPADRCLFDLQADPCERWDLLAEQPATVQRLADRLAQLAAEALPPASEGIEITPADPYNWGGAWAPWQSCESAPGPDCAAGQRPPPLKPAPQGSRCPAG